MSSGSSGRPHRDFYPRPPRGGRPRVVAVVADPDLFLSTPSARRATRQAFQVQKYYEISIHALREEGDPRLHRSTADTGNFYPRPPRGGRLYYFNVPCRILWISIHALREEGDVRLKGDMEAIAISIHALREEGDQGIRGSCVNFIISIHALREEGDAVFRLPWLYHSIFLSTPSARRATST